MLGYIEYYHLYFVFFFFFKSPAPPRFLPFSPPRPFPVRGGFFSPPFSFVTGRVAPTRVTRAGLPMTEAAEKLAPVFLKHGYAFMYLYCRGQGLSADQAKIGRASCRERV